MARNTKREKTTVYVYAIVSKIDKRLYVGQCSAGSVSAVYRHHLNGKYEATANLIEDSIQAHELPEVYLIAEFEGYTNKSKTYDYAFLKYFQENGYDVLVSGEAAEWLKDISDASKQVYNSIATTPVKDILTSDACLIKNYQLKAWTQAAPAQNAPYNGDGPAQFSIHTTNDRKKLMQERAAYCGLSLSEFAEQMMLNGAIVIADNKDIYAAVNSVYKALHDLKKSISYYDGVYEAHANELKRIEAEVSNISETVRMATQATISGARNEAAKAVRKAIKGRGKKGADKS